jgi:S1-C subfamily serine protease
VVANLSPKLADKLRLPLDSVGVVIEDIRQGSPAARLGFAPHDVIVSVNDVDVTRTKDLQDVIDEDPSLWRVEIERDGQRIRQIFR